MKNIIDVNESVKNKDRKFGACLNYIPSNILIHGKEEKALFTMNELQVAIDRAKRNPEDIKEDKTFWESLFG